MPVRGPSVDTVKRGSWGVRREAFYICALREAARTSGELYVRVHSLTRWNVSVL